MATQKRKRVLCECEDSGCPVHPGKDSCDRRAKRKVSRYDYETDGDHFYMCDACANDAIESGVFS